MNSLRGVGKLGDVRVANLVPGAMPLVGRRAALALLGLTVATSLALVAPARSGAAGCANEALREKQFSTSLPECRAWELVSPAQKGGYNVALEPGSTVTAPSGNAFMFASPGVFAGAPASMGLGFYRAQRGSGGWSTNSVELPQYNSSFLVARATVAVSEDLTKSFAISRFALAPGAVENQGNAYLRDYETGENALIATSSEEFNFFDSFSYGAVTPHVFRTPDLSEVAFESSASLSPGATAGTRNVYDYRDGQLRLASYFPGGEPVTEGATVFGLYPTSSGRSRIFFTANKEGVIGLYLREGAETIAVSASQRVESSPAGEGEVPLGAVAAAKFVGASADGSLAYLISPTPLTDTSPSQSEERLYRYEVATRKLTLIAKNPTPSEPPDEAMNPLEVSNNGEYVYFSSHAALAPGSTQAGAEGHYTTNFYVWHGTAGEAGSISFIAQSSCRTELSEGEPVERCPEGATPKEWRASPNGKHFAFASYATLTPYQNSNEVDCHGIPSEGIAAGACTAVYAYDYGAEGVRCVSCDPTGAPPTGDSQLDGGNSGGEPTLEQDITHNVLDEGQVYFDSPDDLTSNATNGQLDVYGASPKGDLRLISSGSADEASYFADATPDGHDVFFRTSSRLVGEDTDKAVDIYDARSGGGIAAQNVLVPTPTECQGDECQGRPAPPPALTAPASTQLLGTESVPAASAPSFSVLPLTAAQRAKLARTGRLTLTVRVARAGTVSLRASARIAGRARLLARVSHISHAAGLVHLAFSLPRYARSALARSHTLHLTLSVSLTGETTVKQITLVVKQPVNGR